MNATATLAIAQPGGRGRSGLSIGWGVSLLVHAAIVAWLLHALAPRPADPAPGKRIEVRLAPPRTPAPAPEPARTTAAPAATSSAPAAPSPSRPRARTRHAPAAPARAPAPAYATRPAPARETPDTNEQLPTPAAAPNDTQAASGTPSDSPSTPTVDIASARRAARLIARESGKATVTLPARKPVVDPNADRAEPIDPIEAARRKDCKTAYAGAGLLAIIPLAIDAVRSAANDSGCKW
jgi:hypothetical protein